MPTSGSAWREQRLREALDDIHQDCIAVLFAYHEMEGLMEQGGLREPPRELREAIDNLLHRLRSQLPMLPRGPRAEPGSSGDVLHEPPSKRRRS